MAGVLPQACADGGDSNLSASVSLRDPFSIIKEINMLV
jgi:hypothetical protein